jgi:peptide/nickel transport system ATP-binding protein
MTVLSVRGLDVAYANGHQAVSDFSLDVAAGETVAVVGASGSGKSTSMLAITRLLTRTATVKAEELTLKGRDLLALSDADLRHVYGEEVGVIYQDPLRSLNPVMTIGRQLTELFVAHGQKATSREQMLGQLESVGIPNPAWRAKRYPHELSGGMRQRVMIAIGLGLGPSLLIADEPTTAVDATVQAQILDLLRILAVERSTATVLVTHDLGVVAGLCDRVVVMSEGRIIEQGTTEAVFGDPQTVVTKQLLAAASRLPARVEGARPEPEPSGETLLSIDGLSRTYVSGVARKQVRALVDVSFEVRRGEALGVVGESGSGKSTLGRILASLDKATSGRITMNGEKITDLRGSALRLQRRRTQMVFQDPTSSLDKSMKVGAVVAEHIPPGKPRGRERVADLLRMVNLPAAYADRLPHQLSGGEAQRVAIARAIAGEPDVIVADEAISSLDVMVQDRVLTIFDTMRRELGLTLVFISHDIGAVAKVCQRVAVMYLGQIVEIGPTLDVLTNPQHPYTASLLSAVPVPDPEVERTRKRILLRGEIPDPVNPPTGCRFHPRCPRGPVHIPERTVCVTQEPTLANGHRCHFPGELTA